MKVSPLATYFNHFRRKYLNFEFVILNFELRTQCDKHQFIVPICDEITELFCFTGYNKATKERKTTPRQAASGWFLLFAEQEKMKAEYEKETAIVNAEKELEVAKLEAQAKLERAKADAEAQIEVARAEAESVKLKSIEVARALGFNIIETEITDEEGVVTAIEYEIDFEGKSSEEISLITEYLKYIEYLGKWDGKLPTVMTGDSASIMLPVDPNA